MSILPRHVDGAVHTRDGPIQIVKGAIGLSHEGRSSDHEPRNLEITNGAIETVQFVDKVLKCAARVRKGAIVIGTSTIHIVEIAINLG